MKYITDYYKTYYLSTGNYDCLVICLSYESIFAYMDYLQQELCYHDITDGNILIDQLLITGDAQNRFLSTRIVNGTFDLASAENIEADRCYHQLTSSELKKNKQILKNSILSSKQISMILRGCVV